MTLIEMLVATTITLVMMGLVAQLFSAFGQGVTGSRSVIELTDQMRSVGWRLRQDLGGVTVPMLPPRRPEASEGYFELLEGPATDTDTTTIRGSGDMTALTGDCDDSLMFTTQSSDAPFVGRFGSKATIESPVAEVAWFCRRAEQQLPGGPTLFTLYRRQLLVMDYVGANHSSPYFPATGGNSMDWTTAGSSWHTFHNGDNLNRYGFDISCRLRPGANGPILVPNSLSDLTKREARIGHFPIDIVNTPTFPYSLISIAPFTDPRLGEDIVLNNVLGFDVRVFDPDAPIQRAPGGAATVTVTPGDPGYVAVGGNVQGFGAYTDLFWGRGVGGGSPTPIGSPFPPNKLTAFQSAGVMISSAPRDTIMSGTLDLRPMPATGPPPPGSPGAQAMAVYDTWSTHYEANGIDENNNGVPDEGTNGLDDNGNGLVDEPAEAETSPPYPVPLRGIEVRIRCYEPSSRQVRQVTIRHTFVPY